MEGTIAVIGLGYVGLPLAVAFAEKRTVIGYDHDKTRVAALLKGHDKTGEVTMESLQKATALKLTDRDEDLRAANIYIVTVPTPVDAAKRPDLSLLLGASETIGQYLKKGDLVIYESTVYPGCTEEDCIPVLEQKSGLRFNEDFFCGYAPERINPGDHSKSLKTIRRVTSGSTPQAAQQVDKLYQSILEVPTHPVSSIRVAEASKVIENTQRDLNISLANELAVIFSKMNIDTLEVLEAAATKWNFMPYKPGLVGGHCISVDPYYLTYKAEQLGYTPDVILSGRRVNDTMGEHISARIVKKMIENNIPVKGSSALIFGLSFKENCPDLRNTKVVDVVEALASYGLVVDVFDPVVDASEATQLLGKPLVAPPEKTYEVLVLAVGHEAFKNFPIQDFKSQPQAVVFDVKGLWPKDQVSERL